MVVYFATVIRIIKQCPLVDGDPRQCLGTRQRNQGRKHMLSNLPKFKVTQFNIPAQNSTFFFRGLTALGRKPTVFGHPFCWLVCSYSRIFQLMGDTVYVGFKRSSLRFVFSLLYSQIQSTPHFTLRKDSYFIAQ